jgi:hypothetical protein
MFLHNLLNILVQIVNEMGLQHKTKTGVQLQFTGMGGKPAVELLGVKLLIY